MILFFLLYQVEILICSCFVRIGEEGLLNKLSLLCSEKERFCNETVTELSSASHISWYGFDLLPVVLNCLENQVWC